jgi:hypothetical protein
MNSKLQLTHTVADQRRFHINQSTGEYISAASQDFGA